MHVLIRRHDAERTVVRAIPRADAALVIDALAGRQIAAYILGTAIPRTERRHGRASAYVMTARDSAWRAAEGTQGFHVELCEARCHFYPFGGHTACTEGHVISAGDAFPVLDNELSDA